VAQWQAFSIHQAGGTKDAESQPARPWNVGTTHVLFEPLDFIARLVALRPS